MVSTSVPDVPTAHDLGPSGLIGPSSWYEVDTSACSTTAAFS
jgi:hypothetical protein